VNLVIYWFTKMVNKSIFNNQLFEEIAVMKFQLYKKEASAKLIEH